MDILDELEFLHLLNPKGIYVKAGDAIALERQIADKLFRAINELLPLINYLPPVVVEAIECYEIVRSQDFD